MHFFRLVEFERRKEVDLGGVRTWIVSCEDLILSKLVRALDTGSELQMRDVRGLLAVKDIDRSYLTHWAKELGTEALLAEALS